MRWLTEIKERRLIPLMAAYLVTGFVALEAIDQLISYEFVPELAYPVTLVLYLFGIPGSLVFAWFHGAPGRQQAPRVEVLLQAGLAVLAIATGVFTAPVKGPKRENNAALYTGGRAASSTPVRRAPTPSSTCSRSSRPRSHRQTTPRRRGRIRRRGVVLYRTKTSMTSTASAPPLWKPCWVPPSR